MKIAAIIPTFDRDGALLPEVIRSIFRTYGEIEICIFEDAGKPLLPEDFEAVRALTGFSHYTTEKPRGGNLNGLPAIRDQLDAMDKFAAETGADWILKIDSDTLLFGDPFTGRENENFQAIFPTNCIAGAHLPQSPAGNAWGWGAAYMLRRECIQKLITFFGLRGDNVLTLGEDREISTACREIYGERAIPFLANLPVDMRYRRTDGTERPLEDAWAYTQHKIAHFGARFSLPPALITEHDRTAYIAARMKFANDFYENADAPL